MMRADSLNFHVDPLRTVMTGTQHITISHVCSYDDIESKGIIADEKLLQVCSSDES